MSSKGRAERRATSSEVEAWVRGSCQRQGVPVKVTDTDVIERVIALLGRSSKDRPPAAHRGRAHPRLSSEPPGGLDAVRVETLSPLPTWSNLGMFENGANDGNAST